MMTLLWVQICRSETAKNFWSYRDKTELRLWSEINEKMREKIYASTFKVKISVRNKIFQILWKSRCNILVIFPSPLKKFRSILRSWLEKLNCGFFHKSNFSTCTITRKILNTLDIHSFFALKYNYKLLLKNISHNWIF